MATFEMNNIRKDADYNTKIKKNSPIVEVFSAMVNRESLERFGKKGDKAVKYIKMLGQYAENGNATAISELNAIRRFVVEAPIMEEMKMLSIFGTYENVAFDETVEREVYDYAGEGSRMQATNGDPIYTTLKKTVYPVQTFTISGGVANDYRRIQLGDMSRENQLMAQIKTDILNSAKAEIVKRIYKAIKDATGVKYTFEGSGLTKAGVDGVINKVRRNGRPTVIGDYALISQFTPWAGYVGSVNGNTITGVSDDIVNQLAATGALAMYNGAILSEMENPYNRFKMNADGDNFETIMPIGLCYVIPTCVTSPIATFTRGGLTTFSGNDVKTGQVLTRFDIEVGCDIAKGHEHEIGVIYDTALGGIN